MPDFLKRVLLLALASTIGWKVITLNVHNTKGLLIALAVTFIACLAIWKWEFE